MNYKIIVDSCGELTYKMKKSGVYETASLSMQVDGDIIVDDSRFDQKDFLKRIAASPECPKSSCPSPEEYLNLSVFSAVLTGALTAYLVFNVFPAKVFMGDTGSLALGGAAACVAVLSKNSLLIPVVGLMFVVSVVSVIMQVARYKLTKKRFFLMAPYHHHLQMKGMSEPRIACVYTVITLVMGVLAVCFG